MVELPGQPAAGQEEGLAYQYRRDGMVLVPRGRQGHGTLHGSSAGSRDREMEQHRTKVHEDNAKSCTVHNTPRIKDQLSVTPLAPEKEFHIADLFLVHF